MQSLIAFSVLPAIKPIYHCGGRNEFLHLALTLPELVYEAILRLFSFLKRPGYNAFFYYHFPA
jgi:hypothetical protein